MFWTDHNAGSRHVSRPFTASNPYRLRRRARSAFDRIALVLVVALLVLATFAIICQLTGCATVSANSDPPSASTPTPAPQSAQSGVASTLPTPAPTPVPLTSLCDLLAHGALLRQHDNSEVLFDVILRGEIVLRDVSLTSILKCQ